MVKKAKDTQYFEGIGRRKEAVAQVRLYMVGRDKTAPVEGPTDKAKLKAGEMMVNKKPVQSFFPSRYEQKLCYQPLEKTQSTERFAISVVVSGGGKQGQLEAVILGIARALNEADREQYRPTLKSEHFLTRDARAKERRKVGRGGKARKKKQSPKR